jgi:hypothetical protein
MNSIASRRPVGNFFVKRSLQISITFKIIFTVLVTSCITIVAIAILYNMKFKGGNFYFMSDNLMKDLELTSILGIVLPVLIASQAITLFFSVGIGLFSSRKAAIPIYKLEKWAQQLKKGRLKTHLGFREEKEMKDLTIQCNSLADSYRQLFLSIDTAVQNMLIDPLPKSIMIQKEIDTLIEILRKVDYKE